jgi:NH3-dependent NAD+ synthetase
MANINFPISKDSAEEGYKLVRNDYCLFSVLSKHPESGNWCMASRLSINESVYMLYQLNDGYLGLYVVELNPRSLKKIAEFTQDEIKVFISKSADDSDSNILYNLIQEALDLSK